MKKYYFIYLVGFGLMCVIDYIYFRSLYNIGFWTFLILSSIGIVITLYAYEKIDFDISSKFQYITFYPIAINVFIVGLVAVYIFIDNYPSNDDYIQREYTKWIDFNKTHDCTLKEIDSTTYTQKYSWLCNDGIIYKNTFNENK